MLCLLGVMLSVLCLVSPAPHTKDTACPSTALFLETIQDVKNLGSKGSSDIALLNYTIKEGGDPATYMEGFIEALKNSKNSVEQRRIVVKLKKIQAYGKSCTGWTSAFKEYHKKAVEEYGFFKSLEDFLRFLGHNALPDENN